MHIILLQHRTAGLEKAKCKANIMLYIYYNLSAYGYARNNIKRLVLTKLPSTAFPTSLITYCNFLIRKHTGARYGITRSESVVSISICFSICIHLACVVENCHIPNVVDWIEIVCPIMIKRS